MSLSGLALHTTTGELGVALINAQGEKHLQVWDLGRRLANEIQIKLGESIQPLSWQDLDFLVVATGPGSYTSTRIGVVTAKTLAQQLQIPVYGVSTLMMIAQHYSPQLELGDSIAVTINSHNEDIFGAVYQLDDRQQELQTLVKPQKFNLEQWHNVISETEKSVGLIQEINAPDKIAFTTISLLELGIIKHNYPLEREKHIWQNLNAFYE